MPVRALRLNAREGIKTENQCKLKTMNAREGIKTSAKL